MGKKINRRFVQHLRGRFKDTFQDSNRIQRPDFEQVYDNLKDGEIAINQNGLPKLYVNNRKGIIHKIETEQASNQKMAKRVRRDIYQFRPSHAATQCPLLNIYDNIYFYWKARPTDAYNYSDRDGERIYIEVSQFEYDVVSDNMIQLKEEVVNLLTAVGETDPKMFKYDNRWYVGVSILRLRTDLRENEYSIILWNCTGLIGVLHSVIDGVWSWGVREHVLSGARFNVWKKNATVWCDNVEYDTRNYETKWLNKSTISLTEFMSLCRENISVFWRVCPGRGGGHYAWRRFIRNRKGKYKKYYYLHKEQFYNDEYFKAYLEKRVCYGGKRIGTNSVARGSVGAFNDNKYIDFAIFASNGRKGLPNENGYVFRLYAKPSLKYDNEWNFYYATDYLLSSELVMVRTIRKQEVMTAN